MDEMTPEQIRLVKNSWRNVLPIAEQAAELFYGRLFELDPTTKQMFNGDMRTQGVKLMKTIGLVVISLDDLGSMQRRIKNLGASHIGYGVKPHHYETVGQALIWTLQKKLGDEFNDDVRRAWTIAYSALADVMKAGAVELRLH